MNEHQKLIRDFYREKAEDDKNLDSTAPMCQVVMALQALNLRCDDWKAQALETAKQEWGDETEIDFNKFECVVKNKKTGRTKTITAEEQNEKENNNQN